MIALNIIKHVKNFSDIPYGSVEYYHILIEALRMAFEEATKGLVSDPEYHNYDYKV